MKRITAILFLSVLLICVSCTSLSYDESEYDEDVLIQPFESVFWVDAGIDPIGLSDIIIEEMGNNNLLALSIDDRNQAYEYASTGTCFAISDNLLLTNQHVVDGLRTVSILLEGDYEPVSVVYEDSVNDIAILKVGGNLPYHFSIESSSGLKKGDYACVIGYPLSDILGTSGCTVTEGIINSLTGINDNPLEIQLSADIQSGNSGSPVLNSDYRVVGMAFSTLSDLFMLDAEGQTAQNVNFAIKSDLINLICSNFLEKDNESKSEEVSSLEEAEHAVFSVFAQDSYTMTASDYGFDEYLLTVSYLCSWYKGNTYIDEVTIKIYTADGNEFFNETYYDWRYTDDVYDDLIYDLRDYIDDSEQSYGYSEL